LRGGEPIASREGVAIAGTPLRFSVLPGHVGEEMRVVEGGDGGWGEVQRVKEGDGEALRRNGVVVVGEDTSGANCKVVAGEIF
jgi:type IV secretory pathway VirJ component